LSVSSQNLLEVGLVIQIQIIIYSSVVAVYWESCSVH